MKKWGKKVLNRIESASGVTYVFQDGSIRTVRRPGIPKWIVPGRAVLSVRALLDQFPHLSITEAYQVYKLLEGPAERGRNEREN